MILNVRTASAGVVAGVCVMSLIIRAHQILKDNKELRELNEQNLNKLAWKCAVDKIQARVRDEGVYGDVKMITNDLLQEYELRKIAVRAA